MFLDDCSTIAVTPDDEWIARAARPAAEHHAFRLAPSAGARPPLNPARGHRLRRPRPCVGAMPDRSGSDRGGGGSSLARIDFTDRAAARRALRKNRMGRPNDYAGPLTPASAKVAVPL